MTPANNIEPIVEASTWALGNQACNVYNGDFTIKDKQTNKPEYLGRDEKPDLRLEFEYTAKYRKGVEQTTVYMTRYNTELSFSGWYPLTRIMILTGRRDSSNIRKKSKSEEVLIKTPRIT